MGNICGQSLCCGLETKENKSQEQFEIIITQPTEVIEFEVIIELNVQENKLFK